MQEMAYMPYGKNKGPGADQGLFKTAVQFFFFFGGGGGGGVGGVQTDPVTLGI